MGQHRRGHTGNGYPLSAHNHPLEQEGNSIQLEVLQGSVVWHELLQAMDGQGYHLKKNKTRLAEVKQAYLPVLDECQREGEMKRYPLRQ